ncbi:MAG: hypothetical protein D6709_03455 [Chloroflexi bacterium]|uniref:Uncharacterized protein n=1 Tax=Candidatus Thermofonsia Clade 3 bacterium TaxID=2364212 RepID=A0A2M8QAF6_9CHLR|nr:MAG: hypothetical protein CUN48_12015 [Candidatus Thermofonsia Clade 3 bacterium]RMG65158.1 MAG: hypothetical protein D6709_03455 [Chloroflexota bacterium]
MGAPARLARLRRRTIEPLRCTHKRQRGCPPHPLFVRLAPEPDNVLVLPPLSIARLTMASGAPEGL